MGLWGTQVSSSKYTYRQLGASGALWSDKPSKHFSTGVHPDSYFSDLKQWSNAFNRFENWVNLSVITTVASNFETYIASVVRVAIESDPGLLVGSSKSIDGAYVAKHGGRWVVDIQDHLQACTRGDWTDRLGAIKKLFGVVPPDLQAVHSELEELRNIRNRFSHAFGRDIKEARRTATLDILPMDTIKRPHAYRLRQAVLSAAKSLDKLLINEHIGEYEVIEFYARLYPTLHKHVPIGQRAQYLKKAVGHHGAVRRGKLHCKGLVQYWEAL